jgi:hypothetical protein
MWFEDPKESFSQNERREKPFLNKEGRAHSVQQHTIHVSVVQDR